MDSRQALEHTTKICPKAPSLSQLAEPSLLVMYTVGRSPTFFRWPELEVYLVL